MSAAIRLLATRAYRLNTLRDRAETPQISLRVLYGYAEAAVALDLPETWLRRHITELPHTKLGQHVKFTEAHLREIAEIFEVRPEQQTAPANVPAGLLELRPLGARAS